MSPGGNTFDGRVGERATLCGATHSPLIEPDKRISRHPALLKTLASRHSQAPRACLAFRPASVSAEKLSPTVLAPSPFPVPPFLRLPESPVARSPPSGFLRLLQKRASSKVRQVLAHYFPADIRLHHLWQTGHLHWRNEADSGSLALRLAGLLPRSPPDGLLRRAPVPLHVRISNLHGELLSVHKISQA